MKHLQKAKDIVKRYRERGFKLPKEQRDVRDNDPVKRQGKANLYILNKIYICDESLITSQNIEMLVRLKDGDMH